MPLYAQLTHEFPDPRVPVAAHDDKVYVPRIGICEQRLIDGISCTRDVFDRHFDAMTGEMPRHFGT